MCVSTAISVLVCLCGACDFVCLCVCACNFVCARMCVCVCVGVLGGFSSTFLLNCLVWGTVLKPIENLSCYEIETFKASQLEKKTVLHLI